MTHPKLTADRLSRMLVMVMPLPDDRIHFRQLAWLRQFPQENIRFLAGIKDMMVCTRNRVLMACAREVARYDEFVFIDGDVVPLPSTGAFWDSDADVVCCKASMPTNADAWSSPTSWHDPLWRCKAEVLQRVPVPYFEFVLDNLGAKELYCICEGFARKCRAAGFSVAVSGECDHQMVQSWSKTGCKDLFFFSQSD